MEQTYSQGDLRTSKNSEPDLESAKRVRTDEQICVLDVIPEILPHFLLRGAFLVHEIAANLDVRAVNDGHLRPDFAYEWDQTRHLRII